MNSPLYNVNKMWYKAFFFFMSSLNFKFYPYILNVFFLKSKLEINQLLIIRYSKAQAIQFNLKQIKYHLHI